MGFNLGPKSAQTPLHPYHQLGGSTLVSFIGTESAKKRNFNPHDVDLPWLL